MKELEKKDGQSDEAETTYKHSFYHLRKLFFPKVPLIVLLVLIFANLLFLNFQFARLSSISSTKPSSSKSLVESSTQVVGSAMCPATCILEIKKSTASAVVTTQTQTVGVASGASPKEYYISLGTGSGYTTSSTTWLSIPGASAYIDSASYPNIKTVTFEVSVSVPTGNEYVNVQLFNVTAGHPVWFSQVQFNSGGTSALLISKPMTLDTGNNLYQVQIQTQLQYTANILQSRVHVVTY